MSDPEPITLTYKDGDVQFSQDVPQKFLLVYPFNLKGEKKATFDERGRGLGILSPDGRGYDVSIKVGVRGTYHNPTLAIGFVYGTKKTLKAVLDYVRPFAVFLDKVHSLSDGVEVRFLNTYKTFIEFTIKYEGTTLKCRILYQDTGEVFLTSPIIMNVTASTGVSSPPSMLLLCEQTRIKIFSRTDLLTGANAAQTVYRVTYTGGREFSEWSCPLTITRYVRSKSCTLSSKAWVLGANLKSLVLYAALRIFLWFLLTGKWDYSILVRSKTREFFGTLSASDKYRQYLLAFESEDLRGYGKYFVN